MTWEIDMRLAVLFVSVGAALSACTTAPASETPPPETAQAERPPMIVGGYSPANLADEGVKAAQAVAVNEIYTRNPTRALVDKVSAETQVVAGLNYRFTIIMTGGAAYRVIVFRNLQGGLSVTSFEKLA